MAKAAEGDKKGGEGKAEGGVTLAGLAGDIKSLKQTVDDIVGGKKGPAKADEAEKAAKATAEEAKKNSDKAKEETKEKEKKLAEEKKVKEAKDEEEKKGKDKEAAKNEAE